MWIRQILIIIKTDKIGYIKSNYNDGNNLIIIIIYNNNNDDDDDNNNNNNIKNFDLLVTNFLS